MRPVFILLALAVLLGVAGWFVALYIEKAEYERRVAAIRAAGQPTTPEELVPDPIPDEENAAVLLREAHALLEKLEAVEPSPLYSVGEEWTDEDVAAADQYVDDARPYRELVDRALARRRLEFADPLDMKAESLAWSIQLTDYSRTFVHADAEPNRRTERVVEAAVLLLDLADLLPVQSDVPWVVRSGLRHSAVDLVRRNARDQGELDAALLRTLVAPRLAKAESPRGPPASVVDGARVFYLRIVRCWLEGRSPEDVHLPASRARMTSPGNRRLVWRDANRMLEFFARARAASETTPEEAHRFEIDGPADVVLHPLSTSAAHFLPSLFENYTREVAVLRLARVALAVMEHRQRTGRWPAALPPDLPVDPFSGKPFLYEGTATGVQIRAASPRPREELADWGLAWDFVD
jgi:hypothetical protein